MSPMRRVALVGFGTVGRAVAKIFCERKNDDGLLRLTHICGIAMWNARNNRGFQAT